jgi:hypothetical protein
LLGIKCDAYPKISNNTNFIRIKNLNLKITNNSLLERYTTPIELPWLLRKPGYSYTCKRFNSTLASPVMLYDSYEYLNPWFITGFTDGEGSFMVSIRKDIRQKTGWRVEALFHIGLHLKDEQLLKDIQAIFKGIGLISIKQQTVFFKVQSLKQILAEIIPFFDRYPLITQKRADYLLFREIVMMMERGEHLNKEGLQ